MHVHVMCSSWQEARKSRMVGSECKKKVSMRAYTVGERKECGCIGVEYMRLPRGRADSSAAVRWSRSNSSNTMIGAWQGMIRCHGYMDGRTQCNAT